VVGSHLELQGISVVSGVERPPLRVPVPFRYLFRENKRRAVLAEANITAVFENMIQISELFQQ